ncbi:MAG TPA: patatin-like phospholipase family protein [Thermoanaerobaculia bacterium]|nr:patatin-like phospholipase family protein [Thermoanaerobaculia bacterium]
MQDRRRQDTPQIEPPRGDLALVMTGGGARAAYQVGVLKAIARRFPDLEIQIITGVSAGAINAVFLAAHRGDFKTMTAELAEHWSRLRTGDVIRSDSPARRRKAIRTVWRLLKGGSPFSSDARGICDTQPLEQVLRRMLCGGGREIDGLAENLAEGSLKSVAVTTLNYATNQTVTWVMGRGIDLWERPNRRSSHARITIDHIMASSALPLIFPAVQLGSSWHGDGGIRLSAPLSPALHLGAKRILAMTTRYQQTFEEADVPETHGYPPPVQVIGNLMDAIFLDVIDQDALRLERLNTLLRKLPEEERGGMKEIDLLVLRPSVNLGRLAGEYETEIPSSLRSLLRGLGSKETSGSEFLSMLMFEPDYLTRLIEIGEADGEARMPEIEALLATESLPSLAAEAAIG